MSVISIKLEVSAEVSEHLPGVIALAAKEKLSNATGGKPVTVLEAKVK